MFDDQKAAIQLRKDRQVINVSSVDMLSKAFEDQTKNSKEENDLKKRKKVKKVPKIILIIPKPQKI